MPNNIINALTIEGSKEQVEAVLDAIKPDKIEKDSEASTVIDFNKIIPMPKSISHEPAGAEEMRGGENWYSWSIANWGTKWNAYTRCFGRKEIATYILIILNAKGERIQKKVATIMFTTAWSGVLDLMQKLSVQHPHVEMHYRYADEDTSSNVGDFVLLNGDIIENNTLEEGSKEAFELYFELWSTTAKESGCIYNDELGTYEFVED